MMHHVKELWRDHDTKLYYSQAWVDANGKPKTFVHPGCVVGKGIAKDKGTKVHDVDGIRRVWFYGEKTWFDTKEERDEYRAMMNEAKSKA